jgi:threonine/homoserine/homoserine lactone efflux protein
MVEVLILLVLIVQVALTWRLFLLYSSEADRWRAWRREMSRVLRRRSL